MLIRWMHLWAFGAIFIIAGVFSEIARVENWHHSRIYNVFENFYRFGAIVKREIDAKAHAQLLSGLEAEFR